ncbi:MAG TPA: signal peptidase I [Terracidiphilus sp.]
MTDQTPPVPAQLAGGDNAHAAAAARTHSSAAETPLETIAGFCSLLVVILFVYGFIIQNFVIPSGSMESTLLIGDHLFVDRITLAPTARWMPLVYYRQPRRGDVIVFIKPVPDEVNGRLEYQYLVKRLIALPGDHVHLLDGIVYINGVAQPQPHAQRTTPENFSTFLDDFPVLPPPAIPELTPPSWSVEFSDRVVNGDLVVPPGEYFMMGDNRHNSADSRYWGFVPRAAIVGRPLFNYWSFRSNEEDYDQHTLSARLAWMFHIALHLFSDTRWNRTFHVIR